MTKEPINFGMFSDEGNAAVDAAVSALIENDTPTNWASVLKELDRIQEGDHPEATDTAVRDEVFAYLAERRLLTDVKTVAIYPDKWDDPIPS